jgi:hypothetical protein
MRFFPKWCISILLFAASLVSVAKSNHPLDFIVNQNQWSSSIKYKANLTGGAVFLTQRGFMYSYYDLKDLERLHTMQHHGKIVEEEQIHCHAYEVQFIGASENAAITASGKRSYYHNYFPDDDSSHWRGHVPLFNDVTYQNLYAGIDAKVYSKEGAFKYDFIVAPHANASLINMKYDGVSPEINSKGDLIISTSVNKITEQAPYAYQVYGDVQKKVACKYAFDKKGNLIFVFPNGYDHNKALIIDPVVVFASYSGGDGNGWGYSSTYDNDDNLYGLAQCMSSGWPTTTGAFLTTFAGGMSIGINKFNPLGTGLLYSSYIGNGQSPLACIANKDGQLVILGRTSVAGLPTTPGCLDNTFNGMFDLFVARLSADGASMLACTYVGGSGYDGYNNVFGGASNITPSTNVGDQNRGDILTDSSGSIYVTCVTQSSNFPVTSGAFQPVYHGSQDACVFKLDSACSVLQYSTYLGGGNADVGFGLSLKANGNLAITGGTNSTDFPTTPGVIHPTAMGNSDGFVAILNTAGSALTQSTYLGTSDYDHGYKTQFDAFGNVYVCGQTLGNYPISSGAFSMTNGNIFIDKLSPDLSSSLVSTRIGINATDQDSMLIPEAFMADDCGGVYFSGWNERFDANLQTTSNAFQTAPSGFWFCKLGSNMSNLNFASYYGVWGDHTDGGGSHFNKQGVLYEAACNHTVFPTTPGAWALTHASPVFSDLVSMKIDFQAGGGNIGAVTAAIGLDANSKDSMCAPGMVQFVNNSANATAYTWDFGDGSPLDTASNPSHFFAGTGEFTVTLHALNPNSCVIDNIATKPIHVFHVVKPLLEIHDTLICKPGQITLTASASNLDSNMFFRWEPSNLILSGTGNGRSVIVNATNSQTFIVTATDSVGNLCKEFSTDTFQMKVSDASGFNAFGDTTICVGDTVKLEAQGGQFYVWTPFNNIGNNTTSTVFVHPEVTTAYGVSISNQDGCVSSFDLIVKVKAPIDADAGKDQYIKPGESVTLQASGGDSYQWFPDINLSPTNTARTRANPDNTTTYFVVVDAGTGCKAIDSVTVHVVKTFVPSAFSPNGDGLNDQLFTIAGENVCFYQRIKHLAGTEATKESRPT